MTKVSIATIKARLSEFLERVEKGERIVVCRHNTPVAELRPVEGIRTEPRPLGPLTGRPAFVVGQAFFEPLSVAELEAWEGGALPMRGARQASEAARATRVAEGKARYGADSPAPRTRRRRS